MSTQPQLVNNKSYRVHHYAIGEVIARVECIGETFCDLRILHGPREGETHCLRISLCEFRERLEDDSGEKQ